MRKEEVITGTLIDNDWLPLEQLAAACTVEPAWLMRHIEEGLLPGARSVAGVWCLSTAALVRVRRMNQIERDFDAVPELAALVADLLEELDTLRCQVRCAGRS